MVVYFMKKFLIPLIASGMMSSAALAEIVVLDFDALAAGETVSGQINPFVSLTTTGGAGTAIAFDTNNPTGGDEDLEIFFNASEGFGPPPSGNVLIIAENLNDANNDGLVDIPDDNAGGGTFTFDFVEEVTFLGFNGIDFTDANGFLQVDLFGDLGSLFSFAIDDVAGPGIDSVLEVGDNTFIGLFANIFGADGVAGVTQAVITLGGSGAIDSLTFEISEVPVPAALPLMLTALGFGGYISRRRKTKNI